MKTPLKTLLGFVLLFLAYQAPEGIGQRLLGSFAWQGALIGVFFIVAYAVGRWRSEPARDTPAPDTHALDTYALSRFGGHRAVTAAFFVAAVCVKLAAVAVGLQFGVYVGGDVIVSSVGGFASALAIAAPMTFFPSIAEDMVTRGYLFRARNGGREPSGWAPAPFVVFSAIVYVLNHVFRLGLGPSEWFMLFVFGSVYALALVRTGSLWPAVALHWGWNYANAGVDAVWAIASDAPARARLLSSAAHIVLAGVVWILTRPAPRSGMNPCTTG